MTETIKTKILERVVYVIRIALNILDPSSPLGLEHEVPDAIEDSEASERDAGLAPEGRDHPPAAADPRAVTDLGRCMTSFRSLRSSEIFRNIKSCRGIKENCLKSQLDYR